MSADAALDLPLMCYQDNPQTISCTLCIIMRPSSGITSFMASEKEHNMEENQSKVLVDSGPAVRGREERGRAWM